MDKSVNHIKVFLVCYIWILSVSGAAPFTELFTYDFGGLEEKSISEQLAIIQEAGLNGITIFEPGNKNDAATTVPFLESWYDLLDRNPEFKISCFYYRHRYNGSWTPRSEWGPVMAKLSERGIPFLVIIKEEKGYKGKVTSEMALKQYQKLNDYGKEVGLPVVIYPHSDTYLESAEEALPYVETINDDNFSLSFHLCHELRAGNKNRIDQVIKNIAPYLSIVTLSGADSKDLYRILPLTEGDYSTEFILPLLDKYDYDGPIGIHTHLIPGPAIDHLSASAELLQERIKKIQESSLIAEGVTSNSVGDLIKIHNGVLTMDLSKDPASNLTCRVYSTAGRVLYHSFEPLKYRTSYSLAFNDLGLVSGNYILEVKTKSFKKNMKISIKNNQ